MVLSENVREEGRKSDINIETIKKALLQIDMEREEENIRESERDEEEISMEECEETPKRRKEREGRILEERNERYVTFVNVQSCTINLVIALITVIKCCVICVYRYYSSRAWRARNRGG